jgi:hypothetical protein
MRALLLRTCIFLVLTVALSGLMAVPYLAIEPPPVSVALN